MPRHFAQVSAKERRETWGTGHRNPTQSHRTRLNGAPERYLDLWATRPVVSRQWDPVECYGPPRVGCLSHPC